MPLASSLPSPCCPSSSSPPLPRLVRSATRSLSISTSRAQRRSHRLPSTTVVIATSPRSPRSPRYSPTRCYRDTQADGSSCHRQSWSSPVAPTQTLTAAGKRTPPKMTSPLAMKLEIKLEKGGEVLNMFGGARTGTSYSLPGHVIVTVPAGGTPGVEGIETAYYRVLQTLEIFFEGKSEFFDEQGRYTPLRLVTVNQSLLAAPARLPPHCSKAGVHTYAHAFDLVIPGWLPPSHISSMTNTSFGLVAKGTIGWDLRADALVPARRARSLSPAAAAAQAVSNTSISSTYRQRLTRSLASALHGPSTSHAHPEAVNHAMSLWKPIHIARHRLPPSADQPNGAPDAESGFERSFTLNADVGSPSPVECHVTVPQWVDATPGDKSLKVSIRIRARPGYTADLVGSDTVPVESSTSGSSSNGSLPRSTRSSTLAAKAAAEVDAPVTIDNTIHMIQLGMEVEETERYTSVPAQTFTSMFPIPDEQPSAFNSSVGPHAFLSPRTHLADMAMLGMDGAHAPYRAMRTKPLLLADDGQPRNFTFAGDGLELCEKWRKVNVVLPMNMIEGALSGDIPQPEFEGPFLRVRHKLKVKVVCRSLATPCSDTVVILSTPLRFGTAPAQPRGTICLAGKRVPIVPLPAYTQLNHENGEQREGEPLPLYEPSAPIDDPPSFEVATLPAPVPMEREALQLSRTSTPTPPASDESEPMDVDSSHSEDEDASSSAAGDVASDSPASTPNPMDLEPPLPPTPRTPGGRKATVSSRHTPSFVAGLAL